mmetsp:Transcript_35911/g.89355  ORF Transcript_35911/g.89355 Transcript_35911/m.89355 type:complete len:206 (-) Transcript_35911:399-1016(-)
MAVYERQVRAAHQLDGAHGADTRYESGGQRLDLRRSHRQRYLLGSRHGTADECPPDRPHEQPARLVGRGHVPLHLRSRWGRQSVGRRGHVALRAVGHQPEPPAVWHHCDACHVRRGGELGAGDGLLRQGTQDVADADVRQAGHPQYSRRPQRLRALPRQGPGKLFLLGIDGPHDHRVGVYVRRGYPPSFQYDCMRRRRRAQLGAS